MPSRKTLIFHIGDHKTGSTSIQIAFAKSLVELEGHNILYPAKLARNALADQCLRYGDAETPQELKSAAKPLEKLAIRIRKTKADFILISAEALEKVPAVLLREVIDTFFTEVADEIRVFAYVRPHPARILSSFAERTKAGVPKTLSVDLEQFAERCNKNGEFIYLPRFAAWRDCFGEAFTLRLMTHSQLLDGSVVDDFVHHAFGGIPFTIAGSSQANESLCLEDLMRLKFLQIQLEASLSLSLKVGWEFSRLTGQLPPSPVRTKLQLHRSLAEDIRDFYLEDARDMDRDFFDGEPLMENELQASVEKALTEPQSTDPADHLSPSELHGLEIMAKMVAGLLEQGDVDWAAFLHAKRVNDVALARRGGPATD